jgi:2-polyprenyl-6-hydroxyphenyl methylase/3-demethylubiquinone-9 3-methyltransferase
MSSKTDSITDNDERDRFVDYYAEESLSSTTVERFEATRDAVLRTLGRRKDPSDPLIVADIGCGAGTQSIIWARQGHQVLGVDINEALLELGRARAEQEGLNIDLQPGSATSLPWPDASVDVCLLPELLEHVADWQTVLDEAIRVLKEDGLLYISTSNYLCPVQAEFDLPLYSWYPGFVKRRYERLSITTRPELVNFAEYPAVNWFSFYSLRSALHNRGMSDVFDRFDIADVAGKNPLARIIFSSIRAIPPLRFLAHMGTPYTVVIAIR